MVSFLEVRYNSSPDSDVFVKAKGSMASRIVDAWRMSHECNTYLLGAIADECLGDRYAGRTRTVAAQFAHMHNVRLRWLQHAAPAHARDIENFPRGAEPTKSELVEALDASADAIAAFLEACDESGSVPQWNGPPSTMLGYLVAHEAHHRALAIIALRLSGHRLPQEVTYGQWQWGKRHGSR